jgi:large subunit ribosomal protein L21
MTYIVKANSHQFLVKTGDYIQVEKLDAVEDAVVELDILASFENGKANLATRKIPARVVSLVKGKKIRVVKYKAKSKYHKQYGHRQQYSLLQINDIK